MLSFEVTTAAFEGPLDLMLHLISQNKLDLFDLNVEELAVQYSAYIRSHPELHLETISEYMTELAGLLEYKSRKLLPRKESVLEEDYEESQKEKLVKRLVEYQQYKEAAQTLEEAMEARGLLLSRPQARVVQEWKKPVENTENMQIPATRLMKAMQSVLRRQMLLNPWQTRVEVKEISVEDKMEELRAWFQEHTQMISFDELARQQSSLHEVIVSFLALLEMIHRDWIGFLLDEKEELWIIPRT